MRVTYVPALYVSLATRFQLFLKSLFRALRRGAYLPYDVCHGLHLFFDRFLNVVHLNGDDDGDDDQTEDDQGDEAHADDADDVVRRFQCHDRPPLIYLLIIRQRRYGV